MSDIERSLSFEKEEDEKKKKMGKKKQKCELAPERIIQSRKMI